MSLYIMSFYMQPGVGLNSKQRQRKDTDGLGCKHHLLTLEPLNITHNSWNTEINVHGYEEGPGEKPWKIKIFLVITLDNMYVLYYIL